MIQTPLNKEMRCLTNPFVTSILCLGAGVAVVVGGEGGYKSRLSSKINWHVGSTPSSCTVEESIRRVARARRGLGGAGGPVGEWKIRQATRRPVED